MWDQHALEAWLEESARRDEDALVIQKYKKQDDSKIKVKNFEIQKKIRELENFWPEIFRKLEHVILGTSTVDRKTDRWSK